MTSSRTTPSSRPPRPKSGRGSASRTGLGNPWVLLAGVLAIQLLLVGLVVAPQLSPRVSGTVVTLRVAPFDPIDPFRGAYADLDYPDLPRARQTDRPDPERGTAFVPLRQEGEVWVGGAISRTEPDGLFLRCSDRGWRLDCGIHSWFASQDRAYALEQELRDNGAIAVIRVDRWGNATIVAISAK